MSFIPLFGEYSKLRFILSVASLLRSSDALKTDKK